MLNPIIKNVVDSIFPPIPENEMLMGLMSLDLQTLSDKMHEIISSWNGEDERINVGGKIYTEDAIQCADEILSKCNELKELLEEMSDY